MREPGGLPESAGFGPLQDEQPKADEAKGNVNAGSDAVGDGDDDTTQDKEEKHARVFTKEEVEKHSKDDDVWIVVRGRVYDCTEYLKVHPGGLESITIYAGKDCSKDFADVHSLDATRLLEDYYIGNLEGAEDEKKKRAQEDEEIRQIQEKLQADVDDASHEVKRCLQQLDIDYGPSVSVVNADEDGESTWSMNPAEAILVTEGWAKILANEFAFSEALLGQWRILVATSDITRQVEDMRASGGEEAASETKDASFSKESLTDLKQLLKGVDAPLDNWIDREAASQVNDKRDQLARSLGARIYYAQDLLIGMLDAAVKSLYPAHMSWSLRHDEHELKNLGLFDGTMEDYSRTFNRCGIQPEHWLAFCEAFLWTVATHVPLCTEADFIDLAKPTTEGAYAAFISDKVARYIIQSLQATREEFIDVPYLVLQHFCRRLTSAGDEVKAVLGESFYQTLFTSHPEFFDYFPYSDMDQLAFTLGKSITTVVESANYMLLPENWWHQRCQYLDNLHKSLSIQTSTYQIIGGNFLKVLHAPFQKEAENRKNGKFPVTAEELENALVTLFFEAMDNVSCAMRFEELVVAEAENLFANVSRELNWPNKKLDKRLLEMKYDITTGPIYPHTKEEIEAGARFAWRISAKNGFRALWRDLVVLDRRHVNTNRGMCNVIEELLKTAAGTGADKTQHSLAVLCPKGADDMWGVRIWSPRFFVYAGYKEDDGSIMGDPASVDFTAHLVKYGLWIPPEERSEFDMLPITFKIPKHQPFAYTIPEDLRHEVLIEHPSCHAIAKLGLRWPAFAVVSNMNMKIGGVLYQCCPFNRFHVSTEVVVGLCEWPRLVQRWAEAMGISSSEPLFQKKIRYEMEVAVLHSFRTQGYTIMDEEEAAFLFATHSRKEREAGRECPPEGELVSPRFEFCCDAWKVTETFGNVTRSERSQSHNTSTMLDTPKVLILFGTETGTSESAAFRLKRALRLLKPSMMTLNDAASLEVVKQQQITHVIAICSTWNSGEFPYNARKFAETELMPNVLNGIKFAVLALGSTLYTDFCRSGIRLNEMLGGAGGKPFLPLTKVDGANGSEGPISDWLQLAKKQLLPEHLVAAMTGTAAEGGEVPLRHEMKWLHKKGTKMLDTLERFSWPEDETFLCLGNEELMDGGDIESRSTRRITFQLPPSCIYETGDHLSVQPLNSIDMVRRFAMCFRDEILSAAIEEGSYTISEKADQESHEQSVVMNQLHQPFSIECFDGQELVEPQLSFSTPVALSDLLQAQVDLTLKDSQLSDLLALLRNAIFSQDGKRLKDGLADRRELLQPILNLSTALANKKGDEKQPAIESFLSHYPSIVDFLETFHFLCERHESKGAATPLLKLADVLQILPRLQARYYSISSSPLTNKSTVSISVGVLHVTTTAGATIHGICSNYLARLCPLKDRAKISVKTSFFRGPENVEDPVIMVGPGTGLAPMMGFLEDRTISQVKPAMCHLFCGCRTVEERIYSKKIDSWQTDGILELHLALSQSTDVPKTYVQNLLEQMGEKLCELLLNDQTHYYICGDAKVANACFEVCVNVLRTYGNKSRVTAVRHIKHMRAENCWQYDLWGSVKQFEEVKVHKKKAGKTNRSKEWLKSF